MAIISLPGIMGLLVAVKRWEDFADGMDVPAVAERGAS